MIWLAVMLALAAKGEPRISVYPAMGLPFPGRPILATVRVMIDNPTPEMYCPEIEVEWSPGNTTKQEGDCEPYETLTPKERLFSWSRTMPLGGGLWNVIVRVQQGKGKRWERSFQLRYGSEGE